MYHFSSTSQRLLVIFLSQRIPIRHTDVRNVTVKSEATVQQHASTSSVDVHSAFKQSVNWAQTCSEHLCYGFSLLPPPPPASFSYSFNFLHPDVVWEPRQSFLQRLWGRRCWELKCHPLWCVVDNETGKEAWITLFHFLNLCPKASPATLSHYFPSVYSLLDHTYRLLWGRIKREGGGWKSMAEMKISL